MTEKAWMDKKDKVGCRANLQWYFFVSSMTDRPTDLINCSN